MLILLLFLLLFVWLLVIAFVTSTRHWQLILTLSLTLSLFYRGLAGPISRTSTSFLATTPASPSLVCTTTLTRGGPW